MTANLKIFLPVQRLMCVTNAKSSMEKHLKRDYKPSSDMDDEKHELIVSLVYLLRNYGDFT